MMKRRFALIPGLFLTLTGCMTNATVELTKAPFDATTDLTNGTSGATHEFLDPTTEFTSSTTPGSLADGHLLRAKQKATLFAVRTQENLRADIARGQGEYLASLATLAGVSTDHWKAFHATMMQSYTTLFDEQMSLSQSSERVVDTAWAHGYGMRMIASR